jgi:hypothetical protein
MAHKELIEPQTYTRNVFCEREECDDGRKRSYNRRKFRTTANEHDAEPAEHEAKRSVELHRDERRMHLDERFKSGVPTEQYGRAKHGRQRARDSPPPMDEASGALFFYHVHAALRCVLPVLRQAKSWR